MNENLRQVIHDHMAQIAARHAAALYPHMDGDTAAQLFALLADTALAYQMEAGAELADPRPGQSLAAASDLSAKETLLTGLGENLDLKDVNPGTAPRQRVARLARRERRGGPPVMTSPAHWQRPRRPRRHRRPRHPPAARRRRHRHPLGPRPGAVARQLELRQHPEHAAQARLTTGERDVGDATGGAHRLDGEAPLQVLQAVPEGLAAAEEDRHDHDVHGVDQVGGEELADGGRAAADADVEATCGLPGRRKRLRRAGVDEAEGVPPFISIEGLT